MTKLILGLWASLLTCSAFAGEFELVRITSDEDREVAKMIAQVDEHSNEIKVIHFRRYLDGKLIRAEKIPAALDYSGRVLVRRKGKNVVRLRGLNVDGVNGGGFEVEYLYNYFTGRRYKLTLNLEKDANQRWIITRKRKRIHHLHCKVWKLGISKIKVKK